MWHRVEKLNVIMKVVDGKIRRIAIVTRTTAGGGGANRVAEELYLLLNDESSVEVDFWINHPTGNTQSKYRKLCKQPAKRLEQLTRVSSNMLRAPGIFELPFLRIARHWQSYDLIHFHDTSVTCSPASMRWFAHRVPVVWTMHDLSPLTGGCIYPMECTKYQGCCHRCPQVGKWPLSRFDSTAWTQAFKRKTAASGLVQPIVPSRWLENEVSQWGHYPFSPVRIPYSVNLERFKPRDKLELARELLSDSTQKFRILVSSYTLAEERKGFRFAIEAIRKLKRDVQLLILGNFDKTLAKSLDGIDHRAIGFVDDRELLAKHFALADVYLFPSLADNLPCSVMEASASGTPTVGFNVGGMPDLVQHDKSGWLADPRDTESLALGLTKIIDSTSMRAAWSIAARNHAVQNYAPLNALNAHLELYERVPEQWRRFRSNQTSKLNPC